MQLVAHLGGEFIDHVGIADIPLLRRRRQRQVMQDQPGHGPGLVLAHAVFEAKSLGIDGAEFGVIAAASLRDIVKKARQVGDFRLFQRLHDAAAVREFVIEAGQRETPQVADHEQRVFVDRVGMEQVVLHAAHDSAERGNVQPQDAVQVHAAQFVGHAGRRAQDRQEQPVVARILAELLVDQVQVAPDQADRPGADAADVGVLLQQQEQLEQRRRVVLEDVFIHGLQVAVLDLEALVEGLRRCVRIHEDGFLEELQQHLVEPRELHHGAVIALHELLDGQRVAGILVAEHLRDPDLVVEQQPVLGTAREDVQREAHAPQEGLAAFQPPQLPG